MITMKVEFRETVWARARSDVRFRAALLTEAINELLAGNLANGKAMLCCAWMHECRERRTRKSGRDYVNATITFDVLAKATRIPTKSLQRMLGPRGNLTAESLFSIITALQESEHIKLAVTTKRAA
jgi:hypothetical protein